MATGIFEQRTRRALKRIGANGKDGIILFPEECRNGAHFDVGGDKKVPFTTDRMKALERLPNNAGKQAALTALGVDAQ